MKIKLLIFLLCAGFLVTGCDPNLARTVQETDEAVYGIIDDAWADGHGTKANYRINTGEPNSVEPLVQISHLQPLTLPQAVALATTQNRFYAAEKENLYLVALEQTDIQHLYEPIPFAGGAGNYQNDDISETAGAFAGYGFEQLLATGAQISSDISLGWVEVISGDMRSGFSSIATAVISQPLLRGAGRKIAMENLTQAQQNTLYQIRSFNRFRKTFVTEIITEYYRVLGLNDRRINARDYYFALAEMYKTLEKRTVGGKLPRHELEQADQDRLQAMRDFVQAQKEYDDAMDAFKLRLAINPASKIRLDMSELEALKEAVAQDVNLSEAQAVEIALNQRLDLSNAADSILDAERKVDVAADAIRTELNLIGGANLHKYDDFRRTRESYELSLQLDLPIDRLFEKNEYRRSLITLMRRQREHQELADTIALEIQNAHRAMVEAKQRYWIEMDGNRLAEKRTANTLLLLQYNRANTRDVLDAKEDHLEAKNDATDALIDYAVAGLDFFRDTGTMKIKPDGMWEKNLPVAME